MDPCGLKALSTRLLISHALRLHVWSGPFGLRALAKNLIYKMFVYLPKKRYNFFLDGILLG